jgi:hypothetical protein
VPGIQKLKKIESFAGPDFSELRGEFICSWCEIREGLLLALPYPNPKREIRRFV